MARRTDYQLLQRNRQIQWKFGSEDLPFEARAKGIWRGVPSDFILPADCAGFNLWSRIRGEVLQAFRRQRIAFHDERTKDYGPRKRGGPSPHLLDPQVCALNFWWPLQQTPGVLADLLRPCFPSLARMVAPVLGGALMEFEWMGLSSYLGEKGFGRRRGEFATSADALLAFEDLDGHRHGILLDTHFTESYEDGRFVHVSRFGVDRVAIYRSACESADSPLLPEVDWRDLFVEPFDQHLRLQLLAIAMERAGELGFKSVTCVHVSPRENLDLNARITSPRLASRGATIGEVWRALLRRPERYLSLTYEAAFAAGAADPLLESWAAYQRARYQWRTGLPGQRHPTPVREASG